MLFRSNESLSLCRGIFRRFNPDVVLGMGGFTSTAPVIAGRMRGIPTFIHESNAFPGKANRHTARFVRAVLLGFMECAAYFPKARTEFTGTPIRSTLRRIDRKEALEKLGLYPGIPTLLVMGGSQGASGINQALIKAMPSLQNIPLQVIHLSGGRDDRLLEDNYRRENIPAHVAAFHHRMEEVYSAADFVIARAGAASLAELAAFALPAMMIPRLPSMIAARASARRIAGALRTRASARIALSSLMAEEKMIKSTFLTSSARCGEKKRRPSCASRSVSRVRALSDPRTSCPSSRRSAAIPLIPLPATPIKWIACRSSVRNF